LSDHSIFQVKTPYLLSLDAPECAVRKLLLRQTVRGDMSRELAVLARQNTNTLDGLASPARHEAPSGSPGSSPAINANRDFENPMRLEDDACTWLKKAKPLPELELGH
jgi:hypothetical protein